VIDDDDDNEDEEELLFVVCSGLDSIFAGCTGIIGDVNDDDGGGGQVSFWSCWSR
jgi:hypothetical protein